MVQKRIKLNCNSLYLPNMCIPKGKDGKLGTLYHYFHVPDTGNMIPSLYLLEKRMSGFISHIFVNQQLIQRTLH